MIDNEESRVAFLERAFERESTQHRVNGSGCSLAREMRADECAACRLRYGRARPETRRDFRNRVFEAERKRNYTEAVGGCDLALDMRADECPECLDKYSGPRASFLERALWREFLRDSVPGCAGDGCRLAMTRRADECEVCRAAYGWLPECYEIKVELGGRGE